MQIYKHMTFDHEADYVKRENAQHVIIANKTKLVIEVK